MRPRKRANWPVIVYRYWVDPEYDTWERLPLVIQQEAAAMRALWNQLVAAFFHRQAAYHHTVAILAPTTTMETRECSPSIAGTRVEPSSLMLRQLQQTFLQATQEVSKASSVTWANKQFVTTQFFAALTRFFNKQGDPPRPRTGEFREVHFQHRFTEGGLPIERIFGHSQRLCLTPVAPEAFSPALSQRQQKRSVRTEGGFQVNGCIVKFRTILHRPLPAGAYLKVAALIGKRIVQEGYHWNSIGGQPTPARWNWSLQLTLEVPPQHLLSHEGNTTAALQVRCELRDEHRVSFAILTDATGREEALFLPETLLTSWQYKCRLQKQAEQLLAVTKQQLQDLPLAGQSPSTQQRFSHLKAARAPGLWRLLHTLEQKGTTDKAIQVLRYWASCSTKLLREARGLEQRYLGHRDWFYHNLALQLCHRYQQLVVTVSDITATPAQQDTRIIAAPHESQIYHQLVAPARFLSFLHQAADKTGTTVKEDLRITTRRTLPAAKTSRFQTQFSGDKAETIAQSPSRVVSSQ